MTPSTKHQQQVVPWQHPSSQLMNGFAAPAIAQAVELVLMLLRILKHEVVVRAVE
jgi:hypothetical protein